MHWPARVTRGSGLNLAALAGTAAPSRLTKRETARCCSVGRTRSIQLPSLGQEAFLYLSGELLLPMLDWLTSDLLALPRSEAQEPPLCCTLRDWSAEQRTCIQSSTNGGKTGKVALTE